MRFLIHFCGFTPPAAEVVLFICPFCFIICQASLIYEKPAILSDLLTLYFINGLCDTFNLRVSIHLSVSQYLLAFYTK